MINLLGDILPGTLRQLGLGKRYHAELAMLNWPDIVGADIASHAAPISIQHGIVHIVVSNSVWCHHLSMMKEEIIRKLNVFIGEKLIQDIRFQAGNPKIYKNVNQNGEQRESINQKIRAVQLDDGDVQQIESLTSGIKQQQLQKKIYRIVEKHVAFQKLKKINNWHKCKSCDSLCSDKTLYCTVCSIKEKQEKLSCIRKYLNEAPWLTYAEMRKYIECFPDEFLRAKTGLTVYLSNEINNGNNEKLQVLTLVMLVTGARPEHISDPLIEKTLKKFGRKKYVSTPGL